MDGKGDLCIFPIAQPTHTSIFLASCFGSPRISNPSTFPLAASVIMVELAAWPYLSCHVHNFAPRFNVAVWTTALCRRSVTNPNHARKYVEWMYLTRGM